MSPANPEPDSTPVDCDSAPRLISAFAASELAPAGVRRLRAHLGGCPPCMESYRRAVETTANLGRTGSQEREQRNVDRKKENIRSKYFGGSKSTETVTRKGGLRLALIPALAIFLMVKVAGLGEPPARVELLITDGAVKIDSRQIGMIEEPMLVLPGRWLQTGKFSKAGLKSNHASVELDARTDCLLEAARPLRFRLRRGLLTVEGDMSIVTVLGVVSVKEGKGQLHIGSSGLTVEPQSGDWKLVNRAGETAIALGETTTITPDFIAAK